VGIRVEEVALAIAGQAKTNGFRGGVSEEFHLLSERREV
jgi:hypothetical protein